MIIIGVYLFTLTNSLEYYNGGERIFRFHCDLHHIFTKYVDKLTLTTKGADRAC